MEDLDLTLGAGTEGEEFVSLKQAAETFNISYERLRKAAWQGRLVTGKFGSQYKVKPTSVIAFIKGETDGRRASNNGTLTNTKREKEKEEEQKKFFMGTGTGTEPTTLARIIAIAVPKGGTAKTTTAINLGAALAEKGKRVLLVDFDPQGNLTQALGLRAGDINLTVYEVLKHYTTEFSSRIEEAIVHTKSGMDLVPATARLNLANDELALVLQRESILKRVLEPVQSNYDFILIDTLPYLGVLVLNALVAAQEVIVPLQSEYLATESVGLIINQVQIMQRSDLNPNLHISGILLTMLDSRTIINKAAAEHIRRAFGKKVHVFEVAIKRTVRFPESQALHKTILEHDSNGDGAQAYRALAQEVLNNRG